MRIGQRIVGDYVFVGNIGQHKQYRRDHASAVLTRKAVEYYTAAAFRQNAEYLRHIAMLGYFEIIARNFRSGFRHCFVPNGNMMNVEKGQNFVSAHYFVGVIAAAQVYYVRNAQAAQNFAVAARQAVGTRRTEKRVPTRSTAVCCRVAA